VEAWLACTGLVGLVLAVLEVFSGVLVDGGDVSSRDRVGKRVVLGFLAQGVDVGTLVACVEAAGGQAGISLQLFGEIGPADRRFALTQ
jgi:hypothetical protein